MEFGNNRGLSRCTSDRTKKKKLRNFIEMEELIRDLKYDNLQLEEGLVVRWLDLG